MLLAQLNSIKLYKTAKEKLQTEFRDVRRTLKANIQSKGTISLKKIGSQKEPALIWRRLEEGLTSKKSESAKNHFCAKELNENFCKVASVHPPPL